MYSYRFDPKGLIEDDALRIAEKEWPLFTRVHNAGGQAVCQTRPAIFMTMRCSQFMAWTPALRLSYECDLDAAIAEGRNLLEEKYAYMMAYTHSDEFARLRPCLPSVSPEKAALINSLIDITLHWANEMAHKYPALMRSSRPISSDQDGWDTSIETYSRGEMMTYSEHTLACMLEHYRHMKAQGINLLEVTDGITARLYGYDSLAEAEQAAVTLLR